MIGVAAVFVAIGMALLALGNERYARQRSDVGRAGLKVCGSVCLAVAFERCTGVWGGAVGPIAWLGLITIATLLVALGLAFAGSWTQLARQLLSR